jgi:hypothetical protein
MIAVPQSSNDINRKLSNEANRIIQRANQDGVILRLLGSIAFRLHCPKYVDRLDMMDRQLTDIDFASYSSERDKVEKLLISLGYMTQSYVLVATATLGRSIYWRGDDKELKTDIFWDRLNMNHTIDFKGRLELDNPTIPLSELLQEKLQIVKLNLKDVKDTIVLLLEHEVAKGSSDIETIDLAPILENVSGDWGYYYTFTMNLKKIRDHLHQQGILSEQEKSIVDGKIAFILEAIESAPKSLRWKMRAKVGPSKKWYNEVE